MACYFKNFDTHLNKTVDYAFAIMLITGSISMTVLIAKMTIKTLENLENEDIKKN